MLEKDILRIKNNPIYQELKGYYSQTTVFSVLGVERNENRHSAFLCWLLDPKADHQLGDEPLKKFLALYATATEKVEDELRAAFVTGRYSIEDVQIDREVLDDVLLPLASMMMPEQPRLLVNDYIRNLGKPALSDDNDRKTRT